MTMAKHESKAANRVLDLFIAKGKVFGGLTLNHSVSYMILWYGV